MVIANPPLAEPAIDPGGVIITPLLKWGLLYKNGRIQMFSFGFHVCVISVFLGC